MYPHTTPGLYVRQPFGDFVVTTLPARLLLDTCYSDRLKATPQSDGSYTLGGSQRRLDDKRLTDIGAFIDKGSASFPNSIILAANYYEADGLEVTDDSRWSFEPQAGSTLGTLTIPQSAKLAAIIDGQHRLFGFTAVHQAARLEMHLVCSIYFELPKPYQAHLFATINATQKPVSKSQTYELFGYNLEKEDEDQWTPDKFAVFIARRLNAEKESPLCGHVIVPAENDFSLTASSARKAGSWSVSLATVVEGVVRLVSANPKKDANLMAAEERYIGRKRSVLGRLDTQKVPLQDLFRESNDTIIYTVLLNYFKAVAQTVWASSPSESFILKTVGIQALFDVARPLIASSVASRDVRAESFTKQLMKAVNVDFTHELFHASGSSRTKIRRCLEFAMGLVSPKQYPSDYQDYLRVQKR